MHPANGSSGCAPARERSENSEEHTDSGSQRECEGFLMAGSCDWLTSNGCAATDAAAAALATSVWFTAFGAV